ncbi:lytic transglycosylase F, partial [Pseudomonas aeruginosa]|nr:lytic transglycosylase F [Pseudomonas aeruginosa]
MTRLLLLSLCLLVLAPLPAAARITGQPDNWHREQPETRDLASIRRAGVLKVLVNQSRNSSGEVKGEPIGVEYRRLRAFEQYLNSRSPSARNLTLKLIPKPKDQLLAALQRGEGDLVAPGELLPAHDGLQVSPSAPVRADVPLVLVARKGNRRYTRLEQLSGRTIPLPAGSAAEGAIELVNQRLAQRRMAPIRIEKLDASLAVEDVMAVEYTH